VSDHKKFRFVCKYPNCIRKYQIKDSLENHILAKHKHKKWPCQLPNCAASYLSSRALAEHNSVKHQHIRYTCAGCNNKYTSKKNLNYHIRIQKCQPGFSKNKKDKIVFLEKHLADIDSQIGTLAALISGFNSFECDDCFSLLNK